MSSPSQCLNQLCFTSLSLFTDRVIRKLGVETKQRLSRHKEDIPQGHQTWQRQLQWILMGELIPCWGINQCSSQLCKFVPAENPPLSSLGWLHEVYVVPRLKHISSVPPHPTCAGDFTWQLLPLPPPLQVRGAAEAKCQLRVQ